MGTKIYQTESVQILRSCLRKGIHIRIHLSEPMDLQSLDQMLIEKMYVVKVGQRGFFRFNLVNIVTITGILKEKSVSAVFAYYSRHQAFQNLNRLFPGIEEKYKLILASSV